MSAPISARPSHASVRSFANAPLVPVTELMDRGLVLMSMTLGDWSQGTRKCVPSPLVFSSTPLILSNITTRSPPSTSGEDRIRESTRTWQRQLLSSCLGGELPGVHVRFAFVSVRERIPVSFGLSIEDPRLTPWFPSRFARAFVRTFGFLVPFDLRVSLRGTSSRRTVVHGGLCHASCGSQDHRIARHLREQVRKCRCALRIRCGHRAASRRAVRPLPPAPLNRTSDAPFPYPTVPLLRGPRGPLVFSVFGSVLVVRPRVPPGPQHEIHRLPPSPPPDWGRGIEREGEGGEGSRGRERGERGIEREGEGREGFVVERRGSDRHTHTRRCEGPARTRRKDRGDPKEGETRQEDRQADRKGKKNETAARKGSCTYEKETYTPLQGRVGGNRSGWWTRGSWSKKQKKGVRHGSGVRVRQTNRSLGKTRGPSRTRRHRR
eukprot:scaffold80_cov325-Pavlova_lutheri.AAC.6